ncbi:MAG: GNAT family N-acetyltransferase [Candidatus Pacebacteria bacterium]|nr:GNAT family N-acetyltransferase [Candidatus Paceibacterota bacterium]
MEIRKLEKENLEDTLKILHQDTLRYADGDYPGPGWVGDMIENKERCFAFGLFEENVLVSVLLSEKLIHKGCILWYIATDPEKRSLGYGGKLLEYFEEVVKSEGLKWIFLNATEDSLNFYKKHGFITSKYSKVYEHVKEF